jgi:hypothetical protein
MSKTFFSNGSYLTPNFCNSMYFTAGGHVHDGGTDDGHAPLIDLATQTSGQIDLTTQVSGLLPYASQQKNTYTGSNTIACNATATAGSALFTTEQYLTYYWRKDYPAVGSPVLITLSFRALSAPITTPGFWSTVNNTIPNDLLPTDNVVVPITICHGTYGYTYIGTAIINTNGVFAVEPTMSSTNEAAPNTTSPGKMLRTSAPSGITWITPGYKGITAFTVTYPQF